jgi:protoporphyrinogen oxidase
MKGLILGAGITGLSAGIKTGFPVYEMSDVPGGICRSYTKDGFEFSVGGGHWLFGNVDYVKTLAELNEYERKAGIYYNTTFPYPIQTLAEKPIIQHIDSMKYWLSAKFGGPQCNLFFHPFNEKYTAGLYDEIVQIDDYKSPPAGGKGFCPVFYDPKEGLNALINAMSDKCEIYYKQKAIAIIPDDKTIIFDNGNYKFPMVYDDIISTLPLDTLMSMCGQTCDLPYTSVFGLNIGAEPDVNTPKEHWLYVPFCKSGFYRVGVYSNIRPNNKISLWVETAFKPGESHPTSGEIIKELQDWRFIGEVYTADETYIKHAYTWNHNKEERERCIQWLKDHNIHSIGRYGKWRFQGIVESIADGLNVPV